MHRFCTLHPMYVFENFISLNYYSLIYSNLNIADIDFTKMFLFQNSMRHDLATILASLIRIVFFDVVMFRT